MSLDVAAMGNTGVSQLWCTNKTVRFTETVKHHGQRLSLRLIRLFILVT